MAIEIWLDPVDPKLPKIELHDGQEVLIGRYPQCHVVIDDRCTIGRIHCSISQRDGVTMIKDRGTRYGVSVNGLRVESARLAPGDLVAIGGVELGTDGVVVYDGRAQYIVRRHHSERADA